MEKLTESRWFPPIVVVAIAMFTGMIQAGKNAPEFLGGPKKE